VSARAEIHTLVVRLADGDRGAIRPAFEAAWPIVQRFCARALASEADADDAAQAALVKVFEQVACFDARRDALAWILSIAAWECRTIRRRTHRRREDFDAAVPWVGAMSPEDEIVHRDLERAAREALSSLSPDDARTVLAAIGEQTKEADVAPATFRKRLQRALERLRVAWRTKHGTP
jgi:RNA polymerase sigma-70 factor (ECF subfamily)